MAKNPVVLVFDCETMVFSLEINGEHVCNLTEKQYWTLDDFICSERKVNG